MNYPKLFQRGQIGTLKLKNRIVMPPMGVNFSSFTGEATDEIIRYYEERAKGDCGLIITEIARIDDKTGIGLPGQLSVSSPKYIRKLTQLTQAVHRHDAKVFIQLHHPGREVGSGMLGGVQSVAPSPIACSVIGETPRELTTEECEDLVRKFVTGAAIAQIAGFDGVELHAAHGYLLNQFLSPYTNQRTDKYGGDFEKRLTFIGEIIFGIRHVCGNDFPISVRLSADEYVDGGLKIEDSIKIAQTLESIGVNSLNISAGTYESAYAIIEPQLLPQGWKKHLAKAIKEKVQIPVIAVNNIKQPAFAESLLEDGVSDFIAVGRALLADPYWGKKAKEGRDDEIRTCLGCMTCFQTLSAGKPTLCTVNPILGRERFYNEDSLKQDGDGRTVAVIGGGPAGMHASMILAQRGFKPVLFEKSDSLGGTLKLAQKPTGKELITELISTMEKELELCDVEVKLNTEGTVEAVKKLNPYGVMVATGGKPIVPPFANLDDANTILAEEVLDGTAAIKDKKVVVVGGGVTGLETAEVLARAGNKVTVVEMTKRVGASLYRTLQLMQLNMLNELGVEVLPSHKVLEIKKDAVLVNDKNADTEKALDADHVVIAVGVHADNAIIETFEDAFDHVTALGDVRKAAQIVDAMMEANDKAYVF